mgnify:CR=1 FL=1
MFSYEKLLSENRYYLKTGSLIVQKSIKYMLLGTFCKYHLWVRGGGQNFTHVAKGGGVKILRAYADHRIYSPPPFINNDRPLNRKYSLTNVSYSHQMHV